MGLNRSFLKGHMVRNGDSIETLANQLGIHPHTLYLKMSVDDTKRKQEFTRDEIELIYKRYNLTPSDLAQIFFS